MVPYLPLLFCETSVSVKENPDRKIYIYILIYMLYIYMYICICMTYLLIYIYIYIFFFHQGFLSRTLTSHRAAVEGRGPYFIPLYHFHSLYIYIHTYTYVYMYIYKTNKFLNLSGDKFLNQKIFICFLHQHSFGKLT